MSEPVNAENLDWQEWRSTDEVRVRFKVLHDGPDAHMGVCVQELPAGCNTQPAHYHLKEEEHLYVLTGELMMRLGDVEHALTVGDYVCFPAADARAHCLFNRSTKPCTYLLWGERDPDDVVIYPDSQKVRVRRTGEMYQRPVPGEASR